MPAQRVVVSGATDAIATLERIERDASKPPPEAGQALAAGIRLEAPIRTGYLRSSVVAMDDASVVVEAPYAVFVDARSQFVARGALRSREAVVDAWQRSADAAIIREGAN
jgi:hypothetical protein